MTRLKSSNCDQTQKVKLWRKKSQRLTRWQNSRIQIMTKLKNSNCDKTKKNWVLTKTWNTTNINFCRRKKTLDGSVRTFWHLDNQWDALWAAFCNSFNVFIANVLILTNWFFHCQCESVYSGGAIIP